jgi:hypothetical protein
MQIFTGVNQQNNSAQSEHPKNFFLERGNQLRKFVKKQFSFTQKMAIRIE